MDYQTFLSLKDSKRTESRIKRYLERLALTPHAQLLGALSLEEQVVVPAEEEHKLIETVETQIDFLKGEKPWFKNRGSEVITLRFGLRDGIPRTLEEIADIFGVTPNRVQQMEKKALRFLRRSKFKI